MSVSCMLVLSILAQKLAHLVFYLFVTIRYKTYLDFASVSSVFAFISRALRFIYIFTHTYLSRLPLE